MKRASSSSAADFRSINLIEIKDGYKDQLVKPMYDQTKRQSIISKGTQKYDYEMKFNHSDMNQSTKTDHLHMSGKNQIIAQTDRLSKIRESQQKKSQLSSNMSKSGPRRNSVQATLPSQQNKLVDNDFTTPLIQRRMSRFDSTTIEGASRG